MTSKIQVHFRFSGYLRVLIIGSYDFRNFSIFYIFEVKESISYSFRKLTNSSGIENPGQLPVQQVLAGTGDWVS